LFCARLFRLDLRRWSKVSVSYESRVRRIVFLRSTACPQITLRFARRLYLVSLFASCLAVCLDRDLSLQVRSIDFHVRRLETIQNRLGRVTITIPFAFRNDGYFRMYSIDESFRSRILRSVMCHFQNCCIEIKILAEQTFFSWLLRVTREQH